MISDIIKNIFRFIILVLVQVLIIRNMDLGRFFVPFIYIMFIIMLPFETPNWLLLIISFFTGIIVDMFYNTMGMHSLACVFIGFARPSVLKLFSPREGYEFGAQPTIQYLGVPWFLSYAAIMTFLHHIVLFYVEVLRFSEFFITFFRVLCSSFITVLLIVITQFLFHRPKNN